MRIDSRAGAAAAALILAGLTAAWLIGPGSTKGQDRRPAEAARARAEASFQAPSLEELGKVKWIPQRVVDAMDLLRERQKKEPPPVPDAEALGLKNVGIAENIKIASAFGRLPRSDDEVDWDATLVRCLVGEPKTLNILLASTLYDVSVVNVLYTSPFTIDWKMTPMGDSETAVEWSTSEDRMMDKVVLRRDITWSDGVPFTARDIEFSFHAVMDYDVPAPTAHVHTDQLRGVKAYDDWTVVYFHKEALPTGYMDANIPIIPQHIFEPTLKRDPTMVGSVENSLLSRNPVTSGPYRFVSWKPGEEIVCERRPEWYEREGKRIRSKPYFKTIRFRTLQDRNAAILAFKKGELDETELTPDQWQEQTVDEGFYARGTKVSGEEWSMIFIGWSQMPIPDVPFFKDRKVREALSYAFPHEEFLTNVCFGLNKPARGLFYPGSWMADPELKPLKQDLRRSARLLTEAGWEDSDGDGIRDKTVDGKKIDFRFTFTISSGNPLYEKIGSLLKRDLLKLGVACEVRQIEWTTLLSHLGAHKLQAFALGWSTGADPDSARNMWTTEALKNGRNYARYSNPRVDELFQRGQREMDPVKRAEIYREIDRTIAGDYPFTFLFFRFSLYAVSRDLRGINFSPRGPFGFSPGVFGLWKKRP